MHLLCSRGSATDHCELSEPVLAHKLPFSSTRMVGSRDREAEISSFEVKATIGGSFTGPMVAIRSNPVLILTFNKRKEE
jgi:hypothetical protein